MDNDEYPTEQELDTIRDWDAFKDPLGLVEYVKSLWWAVDWGFELHRGRSSLFHRRCLKLQLHTGGWLGNESIIESLEKNFMFWYYWVKSTVGGHYWFEIMPVVKVKGSPATDEDVG